MTYLSTLSLIIVSASAFERTSVSKSRSSPRKIDRYTEIHVLSSLLDAAFTANWKKKKSIQKDDAIRKDKIV